MPIPVSLTAKWSTRVSLVASPVSTGIGSLASERTTSPRSVNFTALLSRLTRIWRSRVTSPSDGLRGVGIDQIGQIEAFLGSLGGQQIERALDAFAQIEGLVLQLQLVGFDLGEIEDVVDDRQQRLAAVADGLDVIALLGVQSRCRAAGWSCR